jgi:hypothetical protein
VVSELALADGKEAGMEAGTTSMEAVRADKAGADRAGHAICSTRNFLPTTSRRRPESKPIGNKRTTTVLQPPTSA